MKNLIFRITSLVSVLFFLASCGGGSDSPAPTASTPPAANTTAVKVSGVMTKGSVIVGGVTFTVSPATAIRVDDNPSVNEDNLKTGMVVRLRGQRNDDGITGQAQGVETENEVQGTISSINLAANPQMLVVLGQTIYVDDQTVLANLLSLNGLAVGNTVEVHGLRDASGALRATRLELFGAPGELELKGTVSSLGATTFFINAQEVNFAGAVIEPAGATISNGQLVEVRGALSAGVLVADRVQREDLEDSEFEPAEGEEYEVEGFIASFTAHPGTFQVNNRNVQTAATTTFVNGAAEDLINDAKIEAEGHNSGGVLIARKITFKRVRVEIQAEATATSANSITALGLNVEINSLTDDNSGGIVVTQRYRIRGYEDSTGNLIAVRIDAAGGGDDRLQSRVQAEDEGARTLILQGITANLSGTSTFRDINENLITANQFFTAVTPLSATNAGTLVKIKGTYNGGNNTITVSEVELQD